MFRRLWKGKSGTKKTVTKSSTKRATKKPVVKKNPKSKESTTRTAKGSRKVVKKSPRTSAKSVTKKEGQPRKKDVILIIDDESAFVEACQRTLEAKDYKVMAASNTTQAKEMMSVFCLLAS